MIDKPFSNFHSLARHWPGLDSDDEAEATAKIEEASIEIRALYPDIDARIASKKLSAKVPELVVNRMVKRAMNKVNTELPEGLTQLSSTVGPFGQSMSFSSSDGNLYLTSADKRLLRPGANRKAWTIAVAP